jgi:hypothetical protein
MDALGVLKEALVWIGVSIVVALACGVFLAGAHRKERLIEKATTTESGQPEGLAIEPPGFMEVSTDRWHRNAGERVRRLVGWRVSRHKIGRRAS